MNEMEKEDFWKRKNIVSTDFKFKCTHKAHEYEF